MVYKPYVDDLGSLFYEHACEWNGIVQFLMQDDTGITKVIGDPLKDLGLVLFKAAHSAWIWGAVLRGLSCFSARLLEFHNLGTIEIWGHIILCCWRGGLARAS